MGRDELIFIFDILMKLIAALLFCLITS